MKSFKKFTVNEKKDEREYDYEGDMAMTQLRSIIRNSQLMHDKLLTPTTNLPEWVQSKITLAEDYITTAVNYLSSELDENYIDESSEKGLAAKAKASGVSLSTLRTVYKRGVAAWNSGHRPGTTPQQWGMARVNSYITKGKGTYHGADKDLHEDSRLEKKVYHTGLSTSTAKARVKHWQHADKLSDSDPKAYTPAPGDKTAKTKPSKHTIKYHKMYPSEEKVMDEACWTGYKKVGMKKKSGKMVPNCVPVKEDAPANAVGVAPSNVAGTTGDPPVSRKKQKQIAAKNVSSEVQFTKLVRKVMSSV